MFNESTFGWKHWTPHSFWLHLNIINFQSLHISRDGSLEIDQSYFTAEKTDHFRYNFLGHKMNDMYHVNIDLSIRCQVFSSKSSVRYMDRVNLLAKLVCGKKFTEIDIDLVE